MTAGRLLLWRAGEVIRTKLVRLGPDWQVARFAPPFKGTRDGDVLIDAAARLPYRDGAFAAVYARRILEHLAPDEGVNFARELRRILRPGGVLRVSVPDTEALAKNYLHAIDRARRAPVPEAVAAAHHARLMMIDQFVRHVPGGALAAEIAAGRIPAETVRVGFGDALGVDGEVRRLAPQTMRPTWRQRAKELLRMIGGRRWVKETHATREAHLWIWDRYSLPKLLREAGFVDVRTADATSSAIPDWGRTKLDTSEHGPYDFEPSLIVEARRRG